MNEQSKKLDDKNYLEATDAEKDEEMREQLLYGNGESLVEKDKKKAEYKDKMLNE